VSQSAIDRQRVRRAFGGRAGSYDDYARVQRRVVEKFVRRLPLAQLAPRRILDVGAGTGLLLERLGACFPQASTVGLDLAHNMLQSAQDRLGSNPAAAFVCADGEYLPFGDASFDLVISTSTYQWLPDPCLAFSEAWRVLAPGGTFAFALFGEQTLWELRTSHRLALAATASPSPDRTHSFPGATQVAEAMHRAGFVSCRVEAEEELEEHPDVPALLRSLKRIGAGNAAPGGSAGLAGRRLMTAMMEIYRREHGREGIIPATYEVIYGIGVKG